MKRLLLLLLLFPALPIRAAEPSVVSRVDSRQTGDKIEITYALEKKADIEVFCSTDNGRRFTRLEHVTGDVGPEVAPGPEKRIVWDVLSEVDDLTGEQVVFRVVAHPAAPSERSLMQADADEHPWFLSYTVGFPSLGKWKTEDAYGNATMPAYSMGLMLARAKRFGWYVSGSFVITDSTNSVGVSSVAAGAVARLYPWLYLYAGPGYGWHRIRFNDELSELTYSGVAADLGLMIRMGHIVFQAGTLLTFSEGLENVWSVGFGLCF